MNVMRCLTLGLVMVMSACKADVAEFDFENLPATELTEYDTAPTPIPPDSPIAPEEPEPPTGLALSSWSEPNCEEGTIALAGSSACASLGAPCTEDNWAAGNPSLVDIFVSPGATGDGSNQQSPLGTIQAALMQASEGATIWLSKGSFQESVQVSKGVNLVGACPGETMIRHEPADSGVALTVSTPEAVHITGITLSGGESALVIDSDAKDVVLDAVRLRADGEAALLVTSGQEDLDLTLTHVALKGADVARGRVGVSRVTIESYPTGANIRLRGSASMVADTLLISRGDLLVEESAQGEFTNLVLGDGRLSLSGPNTSATVTEGLVRASGGSGAAVSLSAGILNLVTTAVLGGESTALEVMGEDAALYGRDLLLSVDSTMKSGLEVHSGGYASLERVEVTSVGARAIGVQGQYSELNARSLMVRVDEHDVNGQTVSGIVVGDSAWATLTRARLVGAGLSVSSDSSDVDGTSVSIEQAKGLAVDVSEGASVSLERCKLDGSRGLGARIGGNGSDFRAQDLLIQGTSSSEDDGVGGYGLQVSGGAAVVLERSAVQNNQEVGLLASGAGTTLTASDLTVSGTSSREIDGLFGGGVYALEGANLQLVRTEVSDNHHVGLAAFGEATKVLGSSLVVKQTRAAGCADAGTCKDSGVGVFCEQASCRLVEFNLAANDFCGLVLKAAEETESWSTEWFLAQRGIITDNLIGVDIQLGYFNPIESLIDVYNYGNIETDFSGRTVVSGARPELRLD